MSSEFSKKGSLERQFFRETKKALDLIAEPKPASGFVQTVRRLLGDDPQREKLFRVANRQYLYTASDKNRVHFLPAEWQKELDITRGAWPGCENWWAGYPFIVSVEIRPANDRAVGRLVLNAEVGPISHQRARKGIIEAIQALASANDLGRVYFEAGAADKGRLYSRFLRKNSVVVDDIYSADEVERKFIQLIADFEPEFELVRGVIPQFLRYRSASSR